LTELGDRHTTGPDTTYRSPQQQPLSSPVFFSLILRTDHAITRFTHPTNGVRKTLMTITTHIKSSCIKTTVS
jgi:hypothetical protein